MFFAAITIFAALVETAIWLIRIALRLLALLAYAVIFTVVYIATEIEKWYDRRAERRAA